MLWLLLRTPPLPCPHIHPLFPQSIEGRSHYLEIATSEEGWKMRLPRVKACSGVDLSLSFLRGHFWAQSSPRNTAHCPQPAFEMWSSLPPGAIRSTHSAKGLSPGHLFKSHSASCHLKPSLGFGRKAPLCASGWEQWCLTMVSAPIARSQNGPATAL